MGSLCRTHPDVVRDVADKLCPLVLHNLDETDPVVCPALWEAVLYMVTAIEVK